MSSQSSNIVKPGLDEHGRNIWNAGFRSGYSTARLARNNSRPIAKWFFVWAGFVMGLTGFLLLHSVLEIIV